MVQDEVGIRIYNREYCEDLFPAKWREHAPAPVLPWMFVAGSFSKALSHFYTHGTLVAKLLGQHNVDTATRAFVLEDKSIQLPLTIGYDDAIKLQLSTDGQTWVKLLKPTEAREAFQNACSLLGFDWDTVKNHLIALLEKLYTVDGLIMVKVDDQNAKVLASAFEDEESVDLKVKLKLS